MDKFLFTLTPAVMKLKNCRHLEYGGKTAYLWLKNNSLRSPTDNKTFTIAAHHNCFLPENAIRTWSKIYFIDKGFLVAKDTYLDKKYIKFLKGTA